MYRLVTCFAFLFVFPRLCAVLSRSLPVLSASLSFSGGFSAVFSGLCLLFSFPMRSIGHRLLGFLPFYFFSVLSGVCSATVLHPPSFLWGLSSPPRVPPLFFGLRLIFLYCLCFSDVLVISTPSPGFASAVLELGAVLGVATAPVVPAVAAPLYRPFVSTPHFRMLWFRMLLPVFIPGSA